VKCVYGVGRTCTAYIPFQLFSSSTSVTAALLPVRVMVHGYGTGAALPSCARTSGECEHMHSAQAQRARVGRGAGGHLIGVVDGEPAQCAVLRHGDKAGCGVVAPPASRHEDGAVGEVSVPLANGVGGHGEVCADQRHCLGEHQAAAERVLPCRGEGGEWPRAAGCGRAMRCDATQPGLTRGHEHDAAARHGIQRRLHG
jgi:hypothetical protein